MSENEYQRLEDVLIECERQFRAQGQAEVADALVHALSFFRGSSRTELLGEAEIALKRAHDVAGVLPEELRIRIGEFLSKIDAGFKKAGYR